MLMYLSLELRKLLTGGLIYGDYHKQKYTKLYLQKPSTRTNQLPRLATGVEYLKSASRQIPQRLMGSVVKFNGTPYSQLMRWMNLKKMHELESTSSSLFPIYPFPIYHIIFESACSQRGSPGACRDWLGWLVYVMTYWYNV